MQSQEKTIIQNFLVAQIRHGFQEI